MPEGFKFCGQCGAALAPSDAKPGETAPAGTQAPEAPADGASAGGQAEAPAARSSSAQAPGAPPSPAPSAPAASGEAERERKQVTVLSCALAPTDPGTAPPLASLDAEARHTLLNRLFELARREVERYDGKLYLLERGFTALFGAPVAHEDHAQRAALAALGLVRRWADEALPAGGGTKPALRVGLDTGTVVFGGLDQMAVGAPTEGAVHLCNQAPPGSILASRATAPLLHGAVELAEGEVADAGGEPCLRVLSEGKASYRDLEFGTRTLSPFVGRDREVAMLEQLWEQVGRGKGQAVGISGEAGTGKSRLLYELRQRLREGAFTYLRGDCLSFGTGTPYLPFRQLVRQAAGIADGDPAPQVLAKLRSHLAALGCDPETLLPYLLRLLGVEEGTDALATMEAQVLQKRTFEAVRQVVLQAAGRQPVVLQVEDLHWCDRTSEELLVSLVEVMKAAPILLLATYRSGYQPPWLDRSYAAQITMQRLSSGESLRLMGSLLEGAGLLSGLAPDILEKAEGNPFFLEEMASALLEHGQEAIRELPDTIKGLLTARIDLHPGEHKRLLQTAAVLGREFSLELLRAVWDHPEPLEPLLADLKRWESLLEIPAAENPRFLFAHALTQEVAYESLLSDRLRTLHGAAAQALETLYAARLHKVYDRLAYHYPRAGDTEKTVHYLTLLAERAAREFSHAEAAQALRQALVHAGELKDAERDRRILELVLRLAESLLPLAALPETLESLQEHRGRLEALGDPTVTCRYLFWLAHTYSYLGHQEEADGHARDAIAAAEECGDEATQGKAYYVLGRDGFWAGDFKQGLEESLKAVILLERSGEAWWQGQAYWVAAFHHYARGQFSEALDAITRAHAIGEALADHRLDTSWSAGYFRASLGDWEAGIELCRRGVDQARDPLNTAVALGFLGHAYLEKGDLAQATETLEKAVAGLEGTGMQQLLGWFSTFLAEAYGRLGRLEEALARARQGLAVNEEASFRYGVGLTHRTLGRLALQGGDEDLAGECFAAAREVFEALEVPFEVGRTELDLARLAHAAGGSEEASRHLGAAHRVFNDLQVPRYVKRSCELAEELELPAPGAE